MGSRLRSLHVSLADSAQASRRPALFERLDASPQGLNAASRLRICPGNKGHDTRALQAYLGHKNIEHTVRYTELRRIGSRTSGGKVKD
jgi:hypothetical protein